MPSGRSVSSRSTWSSWNLVTQESESQDDWQIYSFRKKANLRIKHARCEHELGSIPGISEPTRYIYICVNLQNFLLKSPCNVKLYAHATTIIAFRTTIAIYF